jgi:hypothetical protein
MLFSFTSIKLKHYPQHSVLKYVQLKMTNSGEHSKYSTHTNQRIKF